MHSDLQILRAAIETEIDGYRHFLDFADKAAVPNVRHVWLDLAHDEIEHMRILQNQLSSLIKGGDWQSVELPDSGKPSSRAPIATKERPAAAPEFASDVDALRAGLEVEENTYRFYADAAKRTENRVGRQTYEQLANMEMGHYKLIEETIDMLADPAQWQFMEAPPIQEG